MGSSLKVHDTEKIVMDNFSLSCFDNQISGHSCILKGTSTHEYVYKPYDKNEAEFYEYISKNKDHVLSNFIPTYYGTPQIPKPKLEEFAAKVCFKEPSHEENQDLPAQASIETDNTENTESSEELIQENAPKSGQSKSEWCKKLFSRRFDENNTRFLKIQDLTSDIETPCILDLKMGSVPYNSEKFAHQAKKLEKTTSPALKFRICGLQVKNPKSDTEYFRDKYWGRDVKLDEIHNALALFFYDGHKIRRNIIQQFILLLKDLAGAIKASVGFKFYSVSLLLIYDASLDDEDYEDEDYIQTYLKDKLKLKLIDFAKSAYSQHSNELDTDLLTGIENLIKCLTFINDNLEIKPCIY